MSLINYFKLAYMLKTSMVYTFIFMLYYVGVAGFLMLYRKMAVGGEILDGEILFFELQDVIYLSFLLLPTVLFIFLISNPTDNLVFIFSFGNMRKYFSYKLIQIGTLALYVSLLSWVSGVLVLDSSWEYQLSFCIMIFLYSFQVLLLFLMLRAFLKSDILSVLIIIFLSFLEDQLRVYTGTGYYFYKEWFRIGSSIDLISSFIHVLFLLGCILITGALLYFQFINKRVMQHES
ncbi:hypothetical protein [Listeria booriae]|uniref:hypothetical protein n=1 Tax=Listeria booriae TaxID=1552123 RepID=UPI0016272121|nr:hypothetical protein [Listeria booriae]MBC1228443.1 hypothetical protein [Listeria booriae]MBC2366735.1 hypothetical protein [Listeria booriae]